MRRYFLLALGFLMIGVTHAAETPEAREVRIAAMLAKDGLGPLQLGQPATKIVKALGEPAKKSKAALQEADGMMVQNWSYPAKGLTLTLAAEPQKKTAQTLSIIRASAECPLVTKKGIKIGSTRTEVEKAYAGMRDPKNAKDTKVFVAGSVYGGIIFNFEGGKVKSMFFGAAAE